MGGKNAHELALLDQAGQALAEARSLDEIKTVRDKAEAVRKYAQSASLGLDVQNRAAEVKLRAERQAGKLLSQLMLRGGDRRSKGHSDRLKLDDLGLTSNQSKRWQMQARIPENLFRDHITQTCKDGKELTSAGLIRLAKRLKGEPAVRSGHSNVKNGQVVNGHVLNGSRTSAIGRIGKWDHRGSISALGDLVCELRNHHKVLDGILQPIYSGEVATLRPAELRMLRYLMTETGDLLAQIDKLEGEAIGRTCHADRAAV
jgi:hypothetical protein